MCVPWVPCVCVGGVGGGFGFSSAVRMWTRRWEEDTCEEEEDTCEEEEDTCEEEEDTCVPSRRRLGCGPGDSPV